MSYTSKQNFNFHLIYNMQKCTILHFAPNFVQHPKSAHPHITPKFKNSKSQKLRGDKARIVDDPTQPKLTRFWGPKNDGGAT